MVQWLRFSASNTWEKGSILVRELIFHMLHGKKKEKKKKKKISDNFMSQEIPYKGKRNVKNRSIWRLNNIQLNNKWITEETKDERTFWRQMKIKTQ